MMMSPVCCLLYPASCTLCVLFVCMYVYVHSALMSLPVPVPVGGAYKICTILHFDICMCRHVVAFIYPSVWGQLCPRPPNSSISLTLSPSLSLAHSTTAPAAGQRCTSIDNNSQAQKNCIFSIWCRVNNSYIALPPARLLPCPHHAPLKQHMSCFDGSAKGLAPVQQAGVLLHPS